MIDGEISDSDNEAPAFLLGEEERSPRYVDSATIGHASRAFSTPSLHAASWSSEKRAQDVKDAEAAPKIKTLAPSNASALETLSLYAMEFVYDEELEKVDPGAPVEIEVTSTRGAKPSEYALTDVRFDAKSNAVRFSFRPSSAFLHQTSDYAFAPRNLKGKQSQARPIPVTYSFHYGESQFDAAKERPSLLLRNFSSPVLLAPNEIGDIPWESGRKGDRLLLHRASLGKEDTNAMGGAIGEGILSSSSMELTLSRAGDAALLPAGAHIDVGFPYPGDASAASKEKSAFKALPFRPRRKRRHRPRVEKRNPVPSHPLRPRRRDRSVLPVHAHRDAQRGKRPLFLLFPRRKRQRSGPFFRDRRSERPASARGNPAA